MKNNIFLKLFALNFSIGILLSVVLGFITTPVDKSLYTVTACTVGTLLGILHFYINKNILKIPNYGNLLSALVTLVFPLVCLTPFLIFSGIPNELLINLLVAASIGMTGPLLINYMVVNKDQIPDIEILNWRQVIFSLYFWSFTGIASFGDTILGDKRMGIILPLILGGCAFMIFGIVLAGNLLASADSRLKDASGFLYTLFIVGLLMIATFVLLYYIFQIELTVIYPFLFGWGFVLLLHVLLFFKNMDQNFSKFLQALFVIFLIGGLVILVNRISGAYGLVLCSLSLLLAGNYIFGEKKLFLIDKAIVVASVIMASRAILQLYMQRTELISYGIDITTPYTFGLLVMGMALPFILGFIVLIADKSNILSVLLTFLIIELPIIIGLFVHTEAVSSFIFGALGISLIVGIILAVTADSRNWLDPKIQDIVTKTSNSIIPLMVSVTGMTILSASFVVNVSDLTRIHRLIIFGAVILIIFSINLIYLLKNKSVKA